MSLGTFLGLCLHFGRHLLHHFLELGRLSQIVFLDGSSDFFLREAVVKEHLIEGLHFLHLEHHLYLLLVGHGLTRLLLDALNGKDLLLLHDSDVLHDDLLAEHGLFISENE